MHILRHVDLTKVFFVDIQTVPCHDCHAQLDEVRQALWARFSSQRHAQELAAGQTAAELYQHAGRYAEFGKVVCISVGYFRPLKDETLEFRVKSFADDTECEVLRGFATMLARHAPASHAYRPRLDTAGPGGYFLCAHNGREFDYSFLGRRMLICGQAIPPMLDVAGHQPADLPHLLDTMELWKFGDHQDPISLPVLAGSFGIPAPSADLDGAAAARVYYEEKDLGRIVKYCEKSVIATARLFLHYAGQQAIWPEVQLTLVPWPAAVATPPLLRVA